MFTHMQQLVEILDTQLIEFPCLHVDVVETKGVTS